MVRPVAEGQSREGVGGREVVWKLRGSRWDYMGVAGGRARCPMSGQLRLSSRSVVHLAEGGVPQPAPVSSSVKK